MGEPNWEKFIERLDDLEDEVGKTAARFDTIIQGINRLVVAVSGDPDNDILGLVGRMKIIDAQIAELQKQQLIAATELATLKPIVTECATAAAEWSATKHQLAGASKLGGFIWSIIGAGGGVLVVKLIEVFSGPN